MLKTKYVLTSFAKIFSICCASFVFLFLSVRIVDDLADTVRYGRAFRLLLYIYDLPEIFVELSPVITFLSGMFLISEMLKYGELKVLEISGISRMKIFSLLCICGLFISTFSFYVKNFTVPDFLERKGKTSEIVNVSFSSPEHSIRSEKFIPPGRFEKFHLSRTTSDGYIEVIAAEEARFIKNSEWIFLNSTLWVFSSSGVLFETKKFETLSYNLPLKPETIAAASKDLESLTYFQLSHLAANMKEIGITSARTVSALHERLAYPLLNMFLLFVLFPFFSVKRSISRVFIISSSVILSFISYGIYAFGLGLAVSGRIHPAAGVWILHIIIALSLSLRFIFLHKKIKSFII